MNDKPTEVPKIEEKVAPNKEGRIPVLIVDSRSPFPELALYTLDAIPRRGDLINIAITGKLVGYKVDFVTFDPFNERNQIFWLFIGNLQNWSNALAVISNRR